MNTPKMLLLLSNYLAAKTAEFLDAPNTEPLKIKDKTNKAVTLPESYPGIMPAAGTLPQSPLFVEYTTAHSDLDQGRDLAAALATECEKLFTELGDEGDNSSICLPMQVADEIVQAMESLEQSNKSVVFSKQAGAFKPHGKRPKLKKEGKRNLRGSAANDADSTDSGETYLFSDPDYDSEMITGTMVVDKGRVNAVMYGSNNVTMIMPCRNTADPRCHVSLTVDSKTAGLIEKGAHSKAKHEPGMEDPHRLLAEQTADGTIVYTIDYIFSPKAAGELGKSRDALIQNARIRMEATNTVFQNSGNAVRYKLGEVRIAERDFSGSLDSLKYATNLRTKAGSDYVGMITSSSEMYDANGRAWLDCLDMLKVGYFSEIRSCLTYAARLLTIGFSTDPHEISHTLGGGHAYDGSNLYPDARAVDTMIGSKQVATITSGGTEGIRFPILSQLLRYYQGTPVGDPMHNNGRVITFRSKQVYQKLRNLPVDPDPVPVCQPYMTGAILDNTVLRAVPANKQNNVITFIPEPNINEKNKNPSSFDLVFKTKTGSEVSINAICNIQRVEDRINAHLKLEFNPGSAFSIEFIDATTVRIYYTVPGYGAHEQDIKAPAGQSFNGELRVTNRISVPNFSTVICQTGFAQKFATLAPGVVTHPTLPPSQPTNIPTVQPTTPTKVPVNPSKAPTVPQTTNRPVNPSKAPTVPQTTNRPVNPSKAPTVPQTTNRPVNPSNAPTNKAPNPTYKPTPQIIKTSTPTAKIAKTKAPTLSAWDKGYSVKVRATLDKFQAFKEAQLNDRMNAFREYLSEQSAIIDIAESILKKQRAIKPRFYKDFGELVDRYLNIVDTVADMDENSRDKFLLALAQSKWTKKSKPPVGLDTAKKTVALALGAIFTDNPRVTQDPLKQVINRYINDKSKDARNSLSWRVAETLIDANDVTIADAKKPKSKPKG